MRLALLVCLAALFGTGNAKAAEWRVERVDTPARVTAIETVDRCLGDIVAAVQASGGELLITADHGNAEQMLNEDGSANTAHSLNPVPVIVTREGLELRSGGILADVAPTLLELLGIEQPAEMTGSSLIET